MSIGEIVNKNIEVHKTVLYYGNQRNWKSHDVSMDGRYIGSVHRDGDCGAEWYATIGGKAQTDKKFSTRKEAIGFLISLQEK